MTGVNCFSISQLTARDAEHREHLLASEKRMRALIDKEVLEGVQVLEAKHAAAIQVIAFS